MPNTQRLGQDEVIKVLKELRRTEKMKSIQVGLFGSYAKGMQNGDSDIDIVLKADTSLFLIKDGYEEFIKNFIMQSLHKNCDVIDYADLLDDYERAKEDGFEDYCMKTIVDREAIML